MKTSFIPDIFNLVLVVVVVIISSGSLEAAGA